MDPSLSIKMNELKSELALLKLVRTVKSVSSRTSTSCRLNTLTDERCWSSSELKQLHDHTLRLQEDEGRPLMTTRGQQLPAA